MTMQTYTISAAGKMCFQRLQTEATLQSRLRGANVDREELQRAFDDYHRYGKDGHVGNLVLFQDESGTPQYGTDGRPLRFVRGKIVNLEA